MSESRAKCSCPETLEEFGRVYPVTLDVECARHSFPKDSWHTQGNLRPGTVLLKYAKEIDRETGELLTRHDAHALLLKPGEIAVDGWEYMRRFRTETPREVETRLLGEFAA